MHWNKVMLCFSITKLRAKKQSGHFKNRVELYHSPTILCCNYLTTFFDNMEEVQVFTFVSPPTL